MLCILNNNDCLFDKKFSPILDYIELLSIRPLSNMCFKLKKRGDLIIILRDHTDLLKKMLISKWWK